MKLMIFIGPLENVDQPVTPLRTGAETPDQSNKNP